MRDPKSWVLLAVVAASTLSCIAGFNNLLWPLIASGIVVFTDLLVSSVRANRAVGRYAGSWTGHPIDESRELLGTYTITYVGGRLIDLVVSNTKYGTWRARISTHPDVPSRGSGTFSYDDHPMYGEIDLDYNDVTDEIIVHSKGFVEPDKSHHPLGAELKGNLYKLVRD